MAKSANVTKYDAGGSGDNYVADGYIKCVQKIWADSYTFDMTGTNTTIDIATLPANKKIMGVVAVIESSISQTSGTISIGFNSDSAVDTLMKPVTVTHNLTISSIALPAGGILGAVVALTQANSIQLTGFQKVTSGTQTTVAVKLNNWTMTTGTMKTIVYYT
jgi:hypothetical protein